MTRRTPEYLVPPWHRPPTRLRTALTAIVLLAGALGWASAAWTLRSTNVMNVEGYGLARPTCQWWMSDPRRIEYQIPFTHQKLTFEYPAGAPTLDVQVALFTCAGSFSPN